MFPAASTILLPLTITNPGQGLGEQAPEDTQEQDDFVGSGMRRGEEGSKNIVIYKTKRKLSAQK